MMGGTSDPGITRVKSQMCLSCGYVFDRIGTADGTPGSPEDGSVVMCINCGDVSIMRAGRLALANRADLLSLDADTQAELRAMDRRRRALPRGDLRERGAHA